MLSRRGPREHVGGNNDIPTPLRDEGMAPKEMVPIAHHIFSALLIVFK
jgi:hypothetical protein